MPQPLEGGGGKNIVVLVGWGKNANIRGSVRKTMNKGKFSLCWGKKYHFGKKRVGLKYPILGKYTPLSPHERVFRLMKATAM